MGNFEWREFYENDGKDFFTTWTQNSPKNGYCKNVENGRLAMTCEKYYHEVNFILCIQNYG